MSDKKILTVIPARNEEQYLAIIIKSLSKQKPKAKLTVIIDDGSTDDTYNVAKKASEKFDLKCKIIRRKNRGITLDGEAGLARVYNDGFNSVDLSKFDFLLINGADSLLEKNYTQEILKFFDKYPNLVITSGTCPTEKINKDHVHGSAGRFYRMDFFIDICKGRFEISHAWESIPLFLANVNGKIAKHFEQPIVHHLRPRNTRAKDKVFYFRGVSMREVGYWFVHAFGRIILTAFREKSINAAKLMLRGYLNKRTTKELYIDGFCEYQKRQFSLKIISFLKKGRKSLKEKPALKQENHIVRRV